MRSIIILYFFSYLSIIGLAQNTNNIKTSVNETKIKINKENLIIKTIGQNGLPLPQKVLVGNPSIKRYNNSSIILGISNLYQTEEEINVKKKTVKSCLPKKKSIKAYKQIKIIPEIIKVESNDKRKHIILYPKPIEALNPQYKDNSTYNIQYLDVEQGMPSSYIQSIFIDSRENIWLGTYEAGVSVYNGENVISFTKDEGLPNNGILSIVEDNNKNIWFGTDGGGICKYNGNSFTSYTEKDGLLNNSVLSLFIDTKGQLWCGTNGGGISCFDGKVFKNYTKDNGLPNNIINSILEDKDGNIWFGTDDSGILIFDGNIFYNLTIKDGLPSNIILSIIQDTQGNIWFSTKENGLCKLIGHENNYIIEHFTKEQGLSSNAIKSIFQDESGNIWIGTKDAGINKLVQTNINNKKHYVINNFSEKNGMSGNDISSIKEDKSNNIWVGTYGGGVCKIKTNSFIHYTKNEGLADNIVRSIIEDCNGKMWFGTNGGGVNIFDGTYFKQLTKNEGLINNYVNCVVEDNNGNFWLGTKEGLCKYDGKYFTYFTKNDYLLDNTIWSLFNDSKGNIWIGTRHGGVSKFDGKSFTHFTKQNGLKNNTVWSITEDSKGNLWFGTYGDGVCKYDGEYFTHFSNAKGISKTSVWGSLEDSKKRLWFGTSNNGVYIYDGKTFENYTKKQGLPNNTTWSIIEDKNNNIWIATENGLNLLENIEHINNVKLFKNKSKIYTKQDGLKGLDFYSEAVFIDSKNNIWWGSGKSLTRLNLNNFKTKIDTPLISLNSININQEFIDFRNLLNDTSLIIDDFKNDIKFKNTEAFCNYPNNLELAYYLNNITFNFSAINWQAPHKIKYSYTLVGLDKNWSAESTENRANYRNLLPGKYIFKVHAIGVSNIWSNTLEYSFIIKPPWWKTLFARIVYIILSIFFIFILIKWRTSELIKRQHRLEKTVAIRTTEITKAKNELEEINKEKTRFISIFSHDIKNPFGALLSLTDYINNSYDELDDNSRKEITRTINNSAEQTYSLLEELLTWSQTQIGLTNYNPKEINITQIIKENILLNEASLKTKQIDIELDSVEQYFAFADKNLTKTIVRNLLNNAIKFSYHNTLVKIQIIKKSSFLQISISDKGIGMKSEDVKKLFKIDTDTRKIGTSKNKGTGLGLIICNEFIKINKGNIWVESTLNEGSTFYFTLPLN